MTKRHPAAASRVVAGGVSTATALALVAGFAAAARPSGQQDATHTGAPPVRVVVTDAEIPTQKAIRAARAALRQGRRTAFVDMPSLPPVLEYVYVDVTGATAAATSGVGTTLSAPVRAAPAAPAPAPVSPPHTTTRAS